MIFDRYTKIVTIGGGHGLGRILSALSFLGPKLTGIVATTDNGGSTGKLRESADCIAWGDLRNCLSHLASGNRIGSHLLDFRFDGIDELAGHNLGNLILYSLSELYVRPLESINLLRRILKIETRILPMTEFPTDLVAQTLDGSKVMGEVAVDKMDEVPVSLHLSPLVSATPEAIRELAEADLVVLGPGSFFTSTLPALLIPGLSSIVQNGNAKCVYIDNIVPELGPAGKLSLSQRIEWMESILGKDRIDAVITADSEYLCKKRVVIQGDFSEEEVKHRHDREKITLALESVLHQLQRHDKHC